MKTIKVNLSDSTAIEKAIKELDTYQKELMTKIKLFVETLAQDGIAVANARLGATVGDSTQGSIGFGINENGDIVKATISLSGKDALFIEFGAGIYYNNGNAHPKGAELGYTIGSYPSNTRQTKRLILDIGGTAMKVRIFIIQLVLRHLCLFIEQPKQ